MISFRYHVVTIVSVLLALAVGVVLGAGPLRGQSNTSLADQVKSDRRANDALQAQVASLTSSTGFTDDFAKTVAPGLVGNRLTGRVVTLVALPTAQQADVTALKSLVGIAGGNVAGTIRIGAQLLDVGDKQLVDELGTQLESRVPKLRIAPDAGPYERIGALVASAIGTDRKGGARVDNASTSILAGLGTTSLMSVDGPLSRRGDLVLFVTGPGPAGADEKRGASSIVTTLVRMVDAGTAGVVLAGPVSSARPDGQVRAVRDDVAAAREVSTVDSLGSTAGQVVAVMALVGEAAGQTGHYGAVDAADGAMPGARDAQ